MSKYFPKVSIVIVNYNGRKLLEECLRSLFQISYPLDKCEVIVVDNASVDSSVHFIQKSYPSVRLIQLDSNLGFTGGNNIGINHATGDYIVLLNNDTVVDQKWLAELITAAKPKNIGVVSSKLLLSIPYVALTIKSSVVQQSDLDSTADFTPRGVLLQNIISETDDTAVIWYKSGFGSEEKINGLSLRWTTGTAEVLLPVASKNNKFNFVFHGYPTNQQINLKLSLHLSNSEIFNTSINSMDVQQVKVDITEEMIQKNIVYLVQNAGNIVLANGYSKDRGSVIRRTKHRALEFYEEDSQFYNTPTALLAGCGAAMLIKRQVINQIGNLDGHYYMYYEDVDFSLRAWQMGWDIAYAPRARVYHKHRASTGKEESSFFISVTERNHLFLVFTHFPLKVCVQEYYFFAIRVIYSVLKKYYCKFKYWDDYPLWKQRAAGRIEALAIFHKLLPHIIWKRFWWKKKYVRGYTEYKKYLY